MPREGACCYLRSDELRRQTSEQERVVPDYVVSSSEGSSRIPTFTTDKSIESYTVPVISSRETTVRCGSKASLSPLKRKAILSPMDGRIVVNRTEQRRIIVLNHLESGGLAGAANCEQANQVLRRFLPRHNRRFVVKAQQPETAWVEWPRGRSWKPLRLPALSRPHDFPTVRRMTDSLFDCGDGIALVQQGDNCPDHPR